VGIIFKAANVIMAPNADPMKHRASVKGDQFEYTMVVIPLLDFDRAAQVCRDLVEKEGIQSINLCPGFSHEGVLRFALQWVNHSPSTCPGVMCQAP
jgi:hypothetical protein